MSCHILVLKGDFAADRIDSPIEAVLAGLGSSTVHR